MNQVVFDGFDGTFAIDPYAKFNDEKRKMVVLTRTEQAKEPEQYERIAYDRIKDAELQDDGSVKIIMTEGDDYIVPITKAHPKESLVLISKIRTIGFRV